MTKVQAYPGCSGVSHEGEPVELDDKGVAEVSPALARLLCDTHGFTMYGQKPVAEKDKPPVDKFTDMSRADVIGYIKSKGQPVVPSTGTDELRALARTLYSPEERAADLAALEKLKG